MIPNVYRTFMLILQFSQYGLKFWQKWGDPTHMSLEESLSITTGRCDLAIATHARKMHKNLFVVVHPEVLDND